MSHYTDIRKGTLLVLTAAVIWVDGTAQTSYLQRILSHPWSGSVGNASLSLVTMFFCVGDSS